MPTRIIGACLGLTGFAVAIVAGLAADNPADEILGRALLSMLGCQLAGLAIGCVAERAIEERAASHRALHPVDGSSSEEPEVGDSEEPVLVV